MLRYLASFFMAAALVGCSKGGTSAPPPAAKATAPTAAPEKPTSPVPPMPPPNPNDDPAITACDDFIQGAGVDTSKARWRTDLPEPPKLPFDAKRTYFWVIDTNVGTIKVKLLPAVAPMHASSTIYLSRIGFYDGLSFHRVIPGFMAQGGCPEGTGGGSPGYQYDGEIDPKVRHDRPGLLSMANTGRPRSDGSQFFLTFVPTPHLDGMHTIFGEVTEGMATVKALEQRGSRGGSTSEPLMMRKTTIEVE